MLSVHLICVGKLKEKFYLDACAEYVKRLSAYCKLQVTELPEERLPQDPTRGQDRRRSGKRGRRHPGQASAQRQSGGPVRGGKAPLQ